MRRAIARGRMFPQSYSTDRRYGRLSLKAIGLFPMMWSNADDQGRLSGDPEEIKYAVCPNIDHITKRDIPGLLQELQENRLILRYDSPKSAAIQMLDWWDANQKMQWAWPSDYEPPEGWQDHLRYKRGAKEVVTLNWPVSGEDSAERSGEDNIIVQVNEEESSGENPGENSGERSGETTEVTPLTTPSSKKQRVKRKRRGRGNSPEPSGEESSPSPTADTSKILEDLTRHFKREFGRVPASNPDQFIPREPNPREEAQLRDLAIELSRVMPFNKHRLILPAFKEAAKHEKEHISYVRVVLLDWLGVARGPP